MSSRTKPEVFIIESLRFDDERLNRSEGDIISRILALSGKECQYYYIRTRKEFRRVLGLMEESGYRYLHLSCHANDSSMATTLDDISFGELAKILRGRLNDRRLFVSACSMASEKFADALMPNSGCYSILGPAEDVGFGDAAILWASLYHVMFAEEREAMKRKVLREKAQMLADVFRVRLNLFVQDADAPNGHRLIELIPSRRLRRVRGTGRART